MRRQEESEDAVDVEQTREGYKRDFRNALEGQCEMFFVDVKCANTDDVSLMFLLFYSMLHTVCYYA